MAHEEQRIYCLSIKDKLPNYFNGKFVLDIGSLDINGNNQYLFENCGYLGVDISEGRNIDIVSKGHELQLPDSTFDLVISTECFEHDPFYEKTIRNVYRMLKPGGLFLFSCATTGRAEHGTRRTSPEDAPLTLNFGEWGDYYKNLEEADIRAVLDVDSCFSEYEFQVGHKTHDLYFFGKKNGVFIERVDYSFLNSENYSKKQIINLELDLEKTRRDLTEKISQLSASRAEIDDLLNSKSWQLTRPFRYINGFAKKFLR
jgi:SAM-dependent methyltransferase